MQRVVISKKLFSVPDLIVLALIACLIFALVTTGEQWGAQFHPLTQIDLSFKALPKYVLFSAMRGFTAYFISLVFTLVVGYAAAKSALAERFIIPALDILQSIPVLGFLPGLVLGLVALFPKTNIGLELAAILMIVTSQVWNMAFAFYSSVKSVPSDLTDASRVIGLGLRERFTKIELPFAAVNLVWNSLLSMAGGWFFLTVCEAFTLGDQEFRLPGIGAYMAVAIVENNVRAMTAGVVAMTLLIVVMDFVIWRPLLAWVQRFRLEDVPGAAPAEPLMGVVLRESRILAWIGLTLNRMQYDRREERKRAEREEEGDEDAEASVPSGALRFDRRSMRVYRRKVEGALGSRAFLRALEWGFLALCGALTLWGVWKLVLLVSQVSLSTWVRLFRDTFWSLVRVLLCLALSTVWAVPFGVWVGTSARRIRIAQPIIQILASFPAPMLYPLMLAMLFKMGFSFDWASMFLMMAGVQWYVLFNALAGALRVPQELLYSLDLMQCSRWTRWKTLYLPSVFPSLVNAWVMGAGAAWNATILAEYQPYEGKILQTGGLGAQITIAAAAKDFPLLAASLSIMVAAVLIFNRLVWVKLYDISQTRYRMDLG